MTQISTESLEGRLLAQRQVLAALMAGLARQDGAAGLWVKGFLDSDHQVADSNEDPGAVPDPAFAVEFIIAEEKQLLASETRRILEAASRT
ncbi:hypothetical protein [Hyphomonas johnsonii]|uniref:Uncharacterized protein n=1 Tax=Hyphomonas johnsonii MHS-2 TaxID=1280950 RepID=A0A059FE45_9PROT|nr:hypothetical protein [Hyphomonas johnsonii]KCZ88867.1 hypothetical protein HJO_15159 [Hyphomonas johnsonii MHS-2]